MEPDPSIVDLPTRRATKALAARLAAALRPGDLARFDGPLGAGKTYLIRAVLRALGVPPRVRVQSPTFVLATEYATRLGRVVHADLYRLRASHGETGASLGEEVARLGLREARQDGAIVLVEWGEGAEDALGEARVRASLAFAGEGRIARVAIADEARP